MKGPRVLIGLLVVVALAVGTLFLARTPDTDPQAMRAKYGAPPSQFVGLGGGLTVHLRDTGPRDAPTLMLIHGSNASLHTWEPWAARLGARYRLIRLDLPGHGLTGPDPTRRYGAAHFADIVERVRTRLGVGPIIVVGNSMGGGVAWHYALAYPEHLAGLVLIDSVGQPEPGGNAPPLAFQIARVPVLRDVAAMILPRTLIENAVKASFHDPALATPAMVDRYWELLRYPGNRRATIDRFAEPSDAATPARLRRITAPTLILWGADDRLIPVSAGRWLAVAIPGSTLIVYPATGHLPMEERAAQSAADVDHFLRARLAALPRRARRP